MFHKFPKKTLKNKAIKDEDSLKIMELYKQYDHDIGKMMGDPFIISLNKTVKHISNHINYKLRGMSIQNIYTQEKREFKNDTPHESEKFMKYTIKEEVTKYSETSNPDESDSDIKIVSRENASIEKISTELEKLKVMHNELKNVVQKVIESEIQNRDNSINLLCEILQILNKK